MHPSTRHSSVQHFPLSAAPIAISSITAKSLERGGTVFARAKGHAGLYVVRIGNTLARQYVAQEWTTGIEFPFTSTEKLQSFLKS